MHAREACPGTGSRRELLKAALGVAVAGLAPGSSSAQGDPRNARPQTGDRFVYSTGPKKGAVVAPDDLPLGGPHVSAYAQHPATGVVRDGSRLNEVHTRPSRSRGPDGRGARERAAGLCRLVGDLHARGLQRLGLGRRQEDAQVPVPRFANSIRRTTPACPAVPRPGGCRGCL